VIHTFRYDDDRRLAEEWVQTDSHGFLAKLGVNRPSEGDPQCQP
jgi:hypothetical protein